MFPEAPGVVAVPGVGLAVALAGRLLNCAIATLLAKSIVIMSRLIFLINSKTSLRSN
jgi:hypothetical protein